jgi:hypothetical protein
VSVAAILLGITLPLLGVIAQLQRLIPVFKQQVQDNSAARAEIREARDGVRALVALFAVKEAPASESAAKR